MRKADGEAKWDKRLGIRTGAGDYEKEDAHHSRYEPTSYPVLERLAASGYVGRDNVLVDYGCGKGRVGFFMNHAAGCRTIGIEYDPAVHAKAMDNRAFYCGRRDEVDFICASAETWRPDGADRFYFFNPFSERILEGVLRRILESYYEEPREIFLFLYYALDSWLGVMMMAEGFTLVDEIDCRDLFGGDNSRERILVFRVGWE